MKVRGHLTGFYSFFSHHIDFEDKMQFGKLNDKYPLLQRHFAGPGFFL